MKPHFVRRSFRDRQRKRRGLYSLLVLLLPIPFFVGKAPSKTANPTVGLRLELSDPDNESFCTVKEQRRIETTLVRSTATRHTSRHVRQRATSSCVRQVCENVRECVIGHDRCHGTSATKFRRSPYHHASTAARKSRHGTVLEQRLGGRFVAQSPSSSSRLVITPSLRQQCRTAQDYVVEAMNRLGWSEPCRNLLQRHVGVSCFVL